MSTPRSWIPRIAEIIATLSPGAGAALDRASIEVLFQLQRRASITLIKEAGGDFQNGQFVVSRTSLLSWVEDIQRREVVEKDRFQRIRQEMSRSVEEAQAVRGALVSAGRVPQTFVLVDKVLSSSCHSLSPGIAIEPGRLTVSFPPGNTVAALELLYELSLALANDAETFTRLSSGLDISPTLTAGDLLARLEDDRLAGLQGR